MNENDLIDSVEQFIQIEHYHNRLKRYIKEGEELLEQVLPKEEYDLASSLIGYTLLSTLLNCYGYGENATPSWMKRESAHLKRKINKVKRKRSL